MDIQLGVPEQLGIVGLVLLILYFLIKNQGQETSGNQNLMNMLLQTQQLMISQDGAVKDRIAQTLEKLTEMKRMDSQTLGEVHAEVTQKYPKRLYETQSTIETNMNAALTSAITRVETPLNQLLMTLNPFAELIRMVTAIFEVVTKINEIHAWFTVERDSMAKQIAIYRDRPSAIEPRLVSPVTETPETVEAPETSAAPPGEGEHPAPQPEEETIVKKSVPTTGGSDETPY